MHGVKILDLCNQLNQEADSLYLRLLWLRCGLKGLSYHVMRIQKAAVNL